MPENDLNLQQVKQALTYKNAVQDAYQFYHNDIEPRRTRERSSLQNKLYTSTVPIEQARIGVGENQITPSVFGQNNYQWYNSSAAGSHNGVRGTMIAPESLNNTREDLARTITHEFTHEDQIPQRSGLQADFNIITGLNGSAGITHRESNYLKNAYGLPGFHEDQNGETKLSEMHATNRELRMHLQQKFKEQYGRNPQNIEELDQYINHFSNQELLQLLREENGYGEFYGSQYVTGANGSIGTNYDNEDNKANAIKQALIHVAQNSNGFNNGNNTYFAKNGRKLNYLKFFK